MENNSLNAWAAMPERFAEHLVSGFSLAVLEQITKILELAPESKPHVINLQDNTESLRKEKEYWKSFMEVDEWNRDTVREIETAWRKRSHGDQPTVLPPALEQLAENVKEPVEKPPPHARPLRRSHTDPTDLLWVFRRRASLLTKQVQQDLASNQSNECNEPYHIENDERSYKTKQETSEGLVSKTRSSCSDNPCSQDSQPKDFAMEDTENRARESSSDSETRDDTPYEWTAMPVKHHDEAARRKISAPAYRPGRRDSVVAVHANRRASVAVAPRRFNRRGSEAPALTVLARRRNSQSHLAYPVGLRRKNSRAAGVDHQLSVQAKAKHEMLANLVLPAFVDQPPRTRERRNTFTFQGPHMRTKKDEKRYQVAKEILETEKKYLSCLRTLKEVFEEPMRESNLISSKEIDILFPGELVHILTSHTHFMKDLEERLQNWKLQGIVGDIFTKLSGSYHIDVLRIYSNYVNNFPKAIGVINKCSRGSHKVRKFLQNCSSKPECEGLDLPAFLLTPIQRLPRYVLLLRQLSKYTDAEHPDSFHIENALETMKQMINILNDSIQNSCKLANNSPLRRSLKRRSLKKKGKELQKNRQNSQDNDRISLGNSSVSTLSMDSAGPGNSCSKDGSPERNTCQAVTSDSSASPTLYRANGFEGSTTDGRRSQPASTGDMETLYERDDQGEFSVIEEEEDSEDTKDNKNQGQNVFRMAADSLKRNWQRRSKKWRRSTEEQSKRESLGEMDTPSKDNENNEDFIEQCSPVLEQENTESTEDENRNVKVDNKDATNDNTPDSLDSPVKRCFRKNAVSSLTRPRPVSLGFFSISQLKDNDNQIKDKVLSDPSLTKEKESLENSSDVWIRRPQSPLTRRRPSDNVRHSVCSRTSSVFSGESSPLSGSRRSLSRISKESLADSGVSETPGSSPSNTLNSRTRKSLKDKKDKLSYSLTNVSGSSEPKKKLSRLNRRSWGDWISAEMENTQDEVTVERVNDVAVKNKRKFKDVVKQFFTSKKKNGQSTPSYLGESTTNAHCSTKKSPKPSRTEIGEKISTV